MIALMLFAAIIVYIVLSFFILWLAPRFATTAKGKKWAVCIALFIVLWYPVVDPAISYVVYRTYAAQHAGVKIYRTVENVDKVFLDGLFPEAVSIRENKKAFSANGADRNDMAYDAVEYIGPGGVMYEERFDTGFKGRSVIREISAQYIVRQNKVLESRYMSSDKWTILNRDGETIASAQYVYWRGGGPMYIPIETSYHKVYDYSPKGESSLAILIHTVLKPKITN
jgi:hypothetical protein